MWYCDVIVTLRETIPWRLGFHVYKVWIKKYGYHHKALNKSHSQACNCSWKSTGQIITLKWNWHSLVIGQWSSVKVYCWRPGRVADLIIFYSNLSFSMHATSFCSHIRYTHFFSWLNTHNFYLVPEFDYIILAEYNQLKFIPLLLVRVCLLSDVHHSPLFCFPLSAAPNGDTGSSVSRSVPTSPGDRKPVIPVAGSAENLVGRVRHIY